MHVSSTIAKFGLSKAFDHLYKDPDHNLFKLMGWADRFANGKFPAQRKAIREAIEDPSNPSYAYVRHLIYDVDPEVLKTFAVNFFIHANLNDGEYVGGCIAGGRSYLHINANGDADPCAFIHYADSNIREKSLLDIMRSPLFMAYHDGQPFNENMLRPCPMLENPEKLREIVQKTGAKSTDLQSPETAEHLCAKCDAYAARWEPKAAELWEKRKAEKSAGKS